MTRFSRCPQISLITAFVAISLIGCSGGIDGGEIDGFKARQDAGTPAFSGPWADMFLSAYSKSTTELQKKILADGNITEQESSEVQAAFVSCMAGFNIKITLLEHDSSEARVPDGMTDDQYKKIITGCQDETTGDITSLYYQITRNPDNKDEYAIMADCLSRSGLVEKGFSARNYESAFETQKFPFDENDPRYMACGLDPLGLEAVGH